MKLELTNSMKEVSEFFKDLPETYFVGGCVRDLIMSIEPRDYDLCTTSLPEVVESYMKSKGKRVFKVGARFGTLCCKVGPKNELIEVTTCRSETYDFDGRKPKVVYTDSLKKDLQRRDYTINAIACDLEGNVVDPLNGRQDIQERLLKAVGEPRLRFREDPLRILRGIRLASKFGFKIDVKTQKKMQECKAMINRLSKERIIEEINKMLLFVVPCKTRRALELMWLLEMWQEICPSLHLQYKYNQNNLHHDFELHRHTIEVVDTLKNEPILRNDKNCLWVALLHDIGKPYTRTHKSEGWYRYIQHERVGANLAEIWLREFKFSNKDREFIVDSIKNHLKVDNWLKPFDDRGKKT